VPNARLEAIVTGTDRERQELTRLYADFDKAHLLPLWTQRDDLMPATPRPAAVPFVWRWAELYRLAARSGELVPVGRGGERRAIALANPGLAGRPYATPTLWAAIQYLGGHERAPAHRHTQTAFRFVIDGAGVWTSVDGDAVAMRRGDLLLTPSWALHEHHNTTEAPMAWLDGLDIPLVHGLDAGFFEYGADQLGTARTPERSRSERLWAHPGLRPIGVPDRPSSPLAAYRWQHTDEALAAQLELADEGYPTPLGPGHAGVRFVNPGTGRDALTTMRTEFHRLRAGASTVPARVVGSAVWQVFDGEVEVVLGGQRFDLATGDLFAVPSWCELVLTARTSVDLFRFSDEPVYEALDLTRLAGLAGGPRDGA
jgi:gentisate 1,2-dioxygenase